MPYVAAEFLRAALNSLRYLVELLQPRLANAQVRRDSAVHAVEQLRIALDIALEAQQEAERTLAVELQRVQAAQAEIGRLDWILNGPRLPIDGAEPDLEGS
jgi:hypothetical protein